MRGRWQLLALPSKLWFIAQQNYLAFSNQYHSISSSLEKLEPSNALEHKRSYFGFAVNDNCFVKYILFILLMFLQNFARVHQKQLPTPPKQPSKCYKITQLLQAKTPPEIRQHQKRNHYMNSRTLLIENTKKAITSDKHRETLLNHADHKSIEAINHIPIDYSSRESRKTAARSLRQKIRRKSDFSLFVKFEKNRLLRYTTVPNAKSELFNRNEEKVPRYKDSVLFKLKQSEINQEKLKKQGLQTQVRKSKRARIYHQNPEKHPNIEFNKGKGENIFNSSNLLPNRHKKQDLKILHHFNFKMQSKRPSTTNTYSREKPIENDSYIEPW